MTGAIIHFLKVDTALANILICFRCSLTNLQNFQLQILKYTNISLSLPLLFSSKTPPVGSQVDFQVQALIGHIDYVGDGYYIFVGEKSNWSETQTVTIEETTPTEPIPEFPSWFILPFILMGSSVVILCRKQLKRTR